MEETLSFPVNRPFDKRAVLSKFGHEPHNSQVYSSPSGVLTRGLSWRSVRQPATAVVSF